MDDDNAIYARLRTGDQEALRVLVTRYHRLLFDFLYRLTDDHALADDFAQQAFIRILTYQGQAPSHVRGWLFTIARNLAYDHFRSARFRYADTLAEAPYNAQTQTSCPYWAVYSQSFHIASSWAGSICAGQAVYVSAGIWSLWNSASNDIRLSDNPNYPGLRWTFGWTQYALPAGPGGARQAYHCTNTIC